VKPLRLSFAMIGDIAFANSSARCVRARPLALTPGPHWLQARWHLFGDCWIFVQRIPPLKCCRKALPALLLRQPPRVPEFVLEKIMRWKLAPLAKAGDAARRSDLREDALGRKRLFDPCAHAVPAAGRLLLLVGLHHGRSVKVMRSLIFKGQFQAVIVPVECQTPFPGWPTRPPCRAGLRKFRREGSFEDGARDALAETGQASSPAPAIAVNEGGRRGRPMMTARALQAQPGLSASPRAVEIIGGPAIAL
jgi:hypothetical protein